MINKNTRGSVWRKWDLQVHTPASLYQNYGKNDDSTWDKYLTDLENLPSDFSVLGINDYFFIEGYERLLKEKKDNDRLHNIDLLLPVIEFRIEKFAGIDFGPLKRINLHVIFSNELSIETIQSQFLNTLEQSYFLESGQPWNRAITLKSVEELGREIKKKVPPEQLPKYCSDIIEGFNNLNVKEEQIFESLKKDCFRDKYLIAIGKTEWGELKWTDSSIATKKSIINCAHIVFTAVNTVKDFYKAKEQLRKQSVNDLLLDCSDAHYFSISCEKDRIGNCFTWIKADPTFEGLKQIIYEPEERVRIQEDLPEKKNDYQVIDYFSITHTDFCTQSIPLNPNLNTIIGGRSSGKSILLGCIAKKVGTPRKVKEQNPEYEEYLESLLPNIEVHWKDGVLDSTRDIEFFPQSFINSLAADSSEINKLIENIIKNDDTKKAAIDNYYSFCIDNKSKINQEIANYFALKEKAKEIQLEISSQGSKEGIEKQIEKGKQELENIKNRMRTDITEEEETSYKQSNESIAIHTTKIANAQKTILKLESFQKINIINEISDDIIGIPDDLRHDISESYAMLRTEFTTKWTDVLQRFIDQENSTIADSEAQIQSAQKNEVFIKCREFFSQNQSYTEHEKRLKNEVEKLKIINDLEKEVTTLNEKIEAKAALILSLHNEYFLKAQSLSDKIKYEKDEVEISLIAKFNKSKFQDTMAIRFDQRSSEIRNILEYSHESNDKYITFITYLFKRVTNDEIQFKSSYNQQQVLIDIFSENFYEIEFDVSYEGDNLSSMSEGKKAFIILRILLDFNAKECPILIDQPEDDLDNRAIYDQLVTYIRKKKKERQIILVTHNPNIVVGADAEEVIVANQNGINSMNQETTKFEYLSGSLENSIIKDSVLPVLIGQGIKQHVCDVLEGGDEAFKKREQRYGMKV